MARKRKTTRKYKPRNEFRYNFSPVAKGHVNHVFGETDSKYKSMGLTHNPTEKIKSIQLTQNPNTNDKSTSHLQLKVLTTRKNMMSKSLQGWHFAKEDMPIVRHQKKAYKKSTNRQKKSNKKR